MATYFPTNSESENNDITYSATPLGAKAVENTNVNRSNDLIKYGFILLIVAIVLHYFFADIFTLFNCPPKSN